MGLGDSFKNVFISGKNADIISGSIAGAGQLASSYATGTGMKNAWMGGGIRESMAGDVMQGIGSIAGQFGPWGALAQTGLESISNVTDLFAYKPEVTAIKNSYDSTYAPTFDLGSQRDATRDFMGQFNKEANKKILAAGVSGGPVMAGVAYIGKLFARRKARDAENKMKAEMGDAVNRFNQAQEGYFSRENAIEKYQARQAANRGAFGLPQQGQFIFT